MGRLLQNEEWKRINPTDDPINSDYFWSAESIGNHQPDLRFYKKYHEIMAGGS